MNIGSLAKSLMKKTVALAGDGTRNIEFTLLDEAVYDTVTGTFTRTDDTYSVKALMGVVSEIEAAKYKLVNSSSKFVVSMLDYEAAGGRMPATYDKAIVNGRDWLIEKVVIGPFDESLWFYGCEA